MLNELTGLKNKAQNDYEITFYTNTGIKVYKRSFGNLFINTKTNFISFGDSECTVLINANNINFIEFKES